MLFAKDSLAGEVTFSGVGGCEQDAAWKGPPSLARAGRRGEKGLHERLPERAAEEWKARRARPLLRD